MMSRVVTRAMVAGRGIAAGCRAFSGFPGRDPAPELMSVTMDAVGAASKSKLAISGPAPRIVSAANWRATRVGHFHRRRHHFVPRVARGLRGQRRARHRGGADGPRRLAVAASAPTDARRAAGDRGGACRARRHRAVPSDSDHRRHRAKSARRDAGGDRGGLRPAVAGIRRTDADEKSAGSADCDPLTSGGRHARLEPHHQSAGQAGRDPHLPGRRVRRGALLHRSDWRAEARDQSGILQGVSAKGLRGDAFRPHSENIGLRARASLSGEVPMSAAVQTLESDAQVRAAMRAIGAEARLAARILANAPAEQKNHALACGARNLRQSSADILAANARDLDVGKAKGLTGAFLDRLALDDGRIEAIARGLEEVAALPDPVGRVLATFTRPNGLVIERVATPLGVVGVIYESRPNVTADAGALCLKSGNAVVLRGGSDSFHSSAAIHSCLVAGLREAGLPEAAISRAPFASRVAVGEMLEGLGGTLDVIVPRGGKSLVERVQREARVPVFAHLEGVVHVYVDRAADFDKALKLVVNSKMRRTGVCGAAETLLVHRSAAPLMLRPLIAALTGAGCAVRGDAAARDADSRVAAAVEEDWRTEYLDAIIAIRVVDSLEDAIDHIETYGSHHTDCIVTEDKPAAEAFLKQVDSAVVIHNASTQFADGGEFGFGGEIGIATGRMHARGPVGVEQLCTFKYRVRGDGQTRA